jgi:uncharacterized membrane protein
MSMIEEGIEVNVPVRTAYNQWTQFEEFPRFMEGVDRVEQIDDTTLRWHASIGGVAREWTAKITEQIPDNRIAWCSTDGPKHGGVVTFHRLSDDRSRVMLQMEFTPENLTEAAGDALGILRRRVRGDLERFKDFIENRGRETGAWRGHVEAPH